MSAKEEGYKSINVSNINQDEIPLCLFEKYDEQTKKMGLFFIILLITILIIMYFCNLENYKNFEIETLNSNHLYNMTENFTGNKPLEAANKFFLINKKNPKEKIKKIIMINYYYHIPIEMVILIDKNRNVLQYDNNMIYYEKINNGCKYIIELPYEIEIETLFIKSNKLNKSNILNNPNNINIQLNNSDNNTIWNYNGKLSNTNWSEFIFNYKDENSDSSLYVKHTDKYYEVEHTINNGDMSLLMMQYDKTNIPN
jgi:hypothetical protein